jgi:hypothetical protein
MKTPIPMENNNSQELNIKNLVVPAEHAKVGLIDANETYLLASRGSFKTSVGIAGYVVRRVEEMPRHSMVAVGLSFNHIFENTLPPFKASLLAQGFIEDIHFKVSGRPPSNWPKPYIPVLDPKYANVISWYNGTTTQIISLMRKASANGVSAQSGFFDEVKFMDQKELQEEIFPIFRGNEQYFKGCSGYLSKFFATDKEADPAKIRWLLDKRKQVNKQKIDIILTLQLQLLQLHQLYNGSGINKKATLKVQIHAIETRLTILRASCLYVAEISVDDVRPILGNRWYKDKQNNSSARIWNVAYKNLDPVRPGEAFYPAFEDQKHCYSTFEDEDIDPQRSLIITADYQHSIAPLTISQLTRLPGNDYVSHNYVDEVFTLYPEGLRKAVANFCSRYEFHPNKNIFYAYDHTAIGKRLDAKEFYVIVRDELRSNGWNVTEIDLGAAPGHYQKYLDTIDMMDEEKDKPVTYFPIRINRKCEFTIKSINGARAYTSGQETKKDKLDEKKPEVDQRETTHFSDAFDQANDAVNKQKLIREVITVSAFGSR